MKTVFWQQGEAHGLVWDQGLALVSDEIGVDAATSLWNRCRDGLTMSQFLEALAQISGASLLSLPSFVVALDSGSATHMAARGDMVIELSTAAGTEQLDGVQVTTWLERQVAAVRASSCDRRVLVHHPGGRCRLGWYRRPRCVAGDRWGRLPRPGRRVKATA